MWVGMAGGSRLRQVTFEQPSLLPPPLQASPRSTITRFMTAPICAGEGVTVTPAASSALILSCAVPLPPACVCECAGQD